MLTFEEWIETLTEKQKAIVEKKVSEGSSLVCKHCGNWKKFDTKDRMSHCCNPGRADSLKGKKRPGHSELMKRLVESGQVKVFQKGEGNPSLNTWEWKLKILKKKGIDVSCMSEEEISKIFNSLKSSIKKSKKSKQSSCETLLAKYRGLIEEENVDVLLLNDSQLDELLRKLNSLKTILSVSNGGAKRFKRKKFTDLKFNMKAVSVTTKSSFESRYVELFERDQIKWCYEPFMIPTESGFYIPDFLVEYKGKTYLIEVKGYLLDEKKYFDSKIRFALKYCNQIGFEFIFSYNGAPESFEEVLATNKLKGNKTNGDLY